jgi:hypothetical protein
MTDVLYSGRPGREGASIVHLPADKFGSETSDKASDCRYLSTSFAMTAISASIALTAAGFVRRSRCFAGRLRLLFTVAGELEAL